MMVQSCPHLYLLRLLEWHFIAASLQSLAMVQIQNLLRTSGAYGVHDSITISVFPSSLDPHRLFYRSVCLCLCPGLAGLYSQDDSKTSNSYRRDLAVYDVSGLMSPLYWKHQTQHRTRTVYKRRRNNSWYQM